MPTFSYKSKNPDQCRGFLNYVPLLVKSKEEECYRRPFTLNAAGIANSAVAAVLHGTIISDIANGRMTAILDSAITTHIAYCGVTAVLYGSITANVTNGRM